jgi:hypothetical protein
MQVGQLPFSGLSWYPFSERPVIGSKWYMPALGDPFFLFPEESPDGRWHLFGHSWIGIEHFISENGISWEPRKMIVLRGRSPSLFFEDGTYYLLYEKHNRDLPEFRKRTGEKITLRRSRIEMRASEDLLSFGDPVMILDSNEIPFAKEGLKQPRVSRPQLIHFDGAYRLYFGASHLKLFDSGQKCSRYFALAQSDSIHGPYTLANGGKPLLRADSDDLWANMAVGSIRVLLHEERWVALQCAYGWDPDRGKSTSTLVQLESEDGLLWSTAVRKPVLIPPAEGWASSYIVSCDLNYKESESCWYCYYSANRRTRRWWAPESVGLLLGKQPVLRKLFS